MTASRLVIATLSFGLFATVLAAQENDPPSLEALMREADAAVAAQKNRIADTVARALGVFRERRSGAAEIAAQSANVAELGPAAIPNLLKAYETETSGKALRAIANLIAEIGDRGAVAPLLRIAGGEHEVRASNAVRAVGRLAKEEDAAALIALATKAKGDSVRAEGLVALARLGHEAARPLWEAGLEDESARVRRAAVQSYGYIGRPSDVKLLEGSLGDDDDNVGLAAIRALGRVAERTRSTRALTLVHGALTRDDDRFVSAVLDVVDRLRNSTSKTHLKKLVDDLGGEEPARKLKGQAALRKRAAIILFRLGVSYGRDQLAEPYRKAIRARPRRARGEWEELSELYFEFGDWKSTIDAGEKALKKLDNFNTRLKIQTRIARAQARLGKFAKAAKTLKEALGAPPWDLADDPAFEEMRQDRRYRKSFRRP